MNSAVDMMDPDYFYENAIKPSAEKLRKLLDVSIKKKNQDVEDHCHAAMKMVLSESGDKSPRNPKEMTTKMRAGKHTAQELNFHLRFQVPWVPDNPSNGHQRRDSIFGSGSVSLQDYETVTTESILRAPISDICVISKSDVTPEGYYRISRTISDKKADLNTGSGGMHLYLCIRKVATPSDGTPTVSALALIFPDRGEYVPPGFTVAKRGEKPCNLNTGNSCERIFLCFKREVVNSPITDIQIFLRSSKDDEQVPPNYIHLEKSIKNYDADINMSTSSGCYIGLCYKHELSTLSCLGGYKQSKTQLTRRTTMDMGLVFDEILDARQSGNSRRASNWSFDASENLPSQDEADYMYQRTDRSATDEELSVANLPVHQDSNVSLSELTKVSDTEGGDVTPDHTPDRILNHSTDSLTGEIGGLGDDKTTDHADSCSDTSSRRLSTNTEALLAKCQTPPPSHAQSLPQPLLNHMSSKSLSQNSIDKIVILSAHGSPLPRNVALIMLALLTGVFSTGEVFEVSLSILTDMVENLNFFIEELRCVPKSGSYTILDLLISTLCERLDASVEVVNRKILSLLQSLVKRSSGILSKSSTQQIFKGTMFVSSCHAASHEWIDRGYSIPMEDESTDLFSYKVLKTLINSLCMRCEECEVDHCLPSGQDDVEKMHGGVGISDVNLVVEGDEDAEEDDDEEETNNRYNVDHLKAQGENYEIIVDLVTDWIDETIDSYELSKITEIALLATSKKTSSIYSSSFWVHVNSISKTLFSSYDVQNTFILLAALCKISWLGISPSGASGSPSPRHLGNKLLGLDGIFEICRVAGQNLLLSKIFGYQIRRLVVSAVFVNVQHAMTEPRIFRKLIRLVTVLWENWRVHIRLEFPVLCEQLMIKVLQTSSLKIYPIYQYLTLDEVVRWFEQPHMLVEMFVNFDMDTAIVSDWNIFAHLIRVVCKLAEKATDPGTSSQASNGSPWPTPYSEVGYADTLFGVKAVPIEPRHVKVKALHVAANMTRAMMDAAGHANLISQDIITQGASPWVGGSDSDSDGEEEDNNADEAAASLVRHKKSFSMRIKIETYQKGADVLKEGLAIYIKKNSIAKAIKYLVSKGFMSDTARDAASFLRLYKGNFAPSAIGDYLGEGGVPNSPEEEYFTMVRYQYSRAVSFVDMSLDVSLRLYLTGCGFRMPGEAQKIERFVYTFARCFWEDNKNSECCPFSCEDTVLVLVYAVIMLNTDLHHANNDKKRKKDKMTLEQFIRNLRGCDQDRDVDPAILTAMYCGIRDNPIDWVENDVVVESADHNVATDHEQNKAFVMSLIRNLRVSEDLLRSFSHNNYRFGIMGIDLSISMELIAYMFESVWDYFKTVADILLERLSNEETVIFSALDVAVNSLTSCIFVDLKVQKIAFIRQVTKFRELLQSLDSRENSKSKIKGNSNSFVKSSDAWYDNVEKSTAKTAIPIVAEVHGVVTELKDVVRRCARREATKHVFARIENKAGLSDANRFIILEADLKKMTNKNGKFVNYRFFLFSDLLVYAHHGFTSFKVHQQLTLEETAVNGIVAGDETGCCFSVFHPSKSFIVSCSSVAEKQKWYCAIKDASEAAINRKSGKRFTMLKRMQSQELEATERQHMHAKTVASPTGDGPVRRGSDPFIEATPTIVEVPKGLTEQRKLLSTISAVHGMETGDGNADDDGDDDSCQGDQFERTPIENCSDYITGLSSHDATKVFVSALRYWKSQLDVENSMSPSAKLKLYGLYKTAKDGPAPAPSASPKKLGHVKARPSVVLSLSSSTGDGEESAESVAAMQLQAWRDCGDMSSIDAMRTFNVTLFSLHQNWDYELR